MDWFVRTGRGECKVNKEIGPMNNLHSGVWHFLWPTDWLSYLSFSITEVDCGAPSRWWLWCSHVSDLIQIEPNLHCPQKASFTRSGEPYFHQHTVSLSFQSSDRLLISPHAGHIFYLQLIMARCFKETLISVTNIEPTYVLQLACSSV